MSSSLPLSVSTRSWAVPRLNNGLIFATFSQSINQVSPVVRKWIYFSKKKWNETFWNFSGDLSRDWMSFKIGQDWEKFNPNKNILWKHKLLCSHSSKHDQHQITNSKRRNKFSAWLISKSALLNTGRLPIFSSNIYLRWPCKTMCRSNYPLVFNSCLFAASVGTWDHGAAMKDITEVWHHCVVAARTGTIWQECRGRSYGRETGIVVTSIRTMSSLFIQWRSEEMRKTCCSSVSL